VLLNFIQSQGVSK